MNTRLMQPAGTRPSVPRFNALCKGLATLALVWLGLLGEISACHAAGPIAIKGAKIYTVSGEAIEAGTILIRDGKIVSYVTSGNYGHTLGGAVAMGYVPCKGETAQQVLASDYEIEVAGTRVKAKASLAPMYDPKGERVKV